MPKPVLIVPYDPVWKTHFDALRTVYQTQLGPLLTGIEHIGSTAVVGLPAKPILDIDLVIPTGEVLPLVVQALTKLGYTYEGDKGIPLREAFRQQTAEVPLDGSGRSWPAHHLYVCPAHSPPLRQHILFRDYLRRHPDTTAAYAALKQELAVRYRTDRVAYTEAKTAFIQRILHKAEPSDE